MVYIIYPYFYDFNSSKFNIGGIETYLYNLSKLLISNGFEVTVFQTSDIAFEKVIEGIVIKGIVASSIKTQRISKELCTYLPYNPGNGFVIFGSELYSRKVPGYKSIVVQHGIYWDLPSHRKGILQAIKKIVNAYRTKRWISIADRVVTVDYNFLNWYRATFLHDGVNKIKVIPNFSFVPPYENQKQDADLIKIIFARRFVEYRGTRIFAAAINRILNEYCNIEVFIAGKGPDEDFMKHYLSSHKNVQFVEYMNFESLKMHEDKQIAVVPTIGSEGTSLSLLEAMAASCAVICTNVGGMTNVIIDRYNGLIIEPDENALYDSLCELIWNRELRKHIAHNGYQTVYNSFSKDIWDEKWKRIINSL